jgi:hypothetical protein
MADLLHNTLQASQAYVDAAERFGDAVFAHGPRLFSVDSDFVSLVSVHGGCKIQPTTQMQDTTLVRPKIAPIPERHSYIVRLGKGGTDMKRASALSYLSHVCPLLPQP